MTPTLKQLALKYASQGFHVFPLTPNSKIPFKGSRGLNDATIDRDQINQWWDENPDANIGIRTGEISGISVVDYDEKSGGMRTYDDWVSGPDRTFTVATANGGRHEYYQYDKALKQTAGLGKGVDVRNDGGYVVGPGSIVEGKSYTVAINAPFAPLLQHIKDRQSPAPSAPASGQTNNGAGIFEGGRNAGLTAVAGALRRQGLSEEGMLAALLALNETECVPPLPIKEVETISWSIARKDPTPDEVPSSTIIKVQDLISPSFDYLMDKDLVKGEPTGFTDLDELLGGGFRRGELIALHAQAKTGKNVLLHRWLLNFAEKGIPVGYASRELRPKEEVIPDLISKTLYRNAWTDKSLTLDEMEVASKNWPIYFSHGQGHFPGDQLRTWVTNLKENYGVNYFLVDHLHYCLPKEEWQLAAEFIRVLKALANNLNVCMIVIIQPTQPKEGLELGLSTLKGGSAIGQAIDTLLCMNHIYYTGEDGRKHREDNFRELAVVEVRHKLARRGQLFLEYNPTTTDIQEGIYNPATQQKKVIKSGWDSESYQVE